jgi:hypothetical protein
VKITAITCVKNEGPFLLEWIAFNRVIGVTDFLFYSNDCDDGTDVLLDALQTKGIVQHLANPADGRNYQMEALKDAKVQKVVKKADWVWIADVDEFLNIHTGQGTIPELVKAAGNPQAISVTFQFFSNCDVEEFVDTPVISQFLKTHNPDIWCDQLAIEVKTLVRNDFHVKYYGAHRPFFPSRFGPERYPIWADGSGRQVPDNFKTADNSRRIRRFPAGGARNLATLNHYALRSLDSYIVKNDRGDVNRENRQFDDTYWRDRNDDILYEDSILKYMPRLLAELEYLKSDPEIAALHEVSVNLHREKCAALMAQRPYASLRAHLLQSPKTSLAEEMTMDRLYHDLSIL